MATNNSCNFSLGTIGQVLTMTSSTTMAFQNPYNRSQSSSTRSLNTIFQVNATRDSLVIYSIDISCTSTLLGGQTGIVFLEISPSSTFSTGIQQICEFTNGNNVSLAIAITVTQTNTAVLNGFIPSGYYVRLRTTNVTGTPTFTYQYGQEILL